MFLVESNNGVEPTSFICFPDLSSCLRLVGVGPGFEAFMKPILLQELRAETAAKTSVFGRKPQIQLFSLKSRKRQELWEEQKKNWPAAM